MDQTKPELTLEESLKQVMQTLPPAIRNYLTQGKYTAVAKDLMTKHALRIDQGGVLEREIMLLLMGVENPEEFTKALAEDAKLDQQTINGIVQEVNTQIFIPLRNEMMRKPAVAGAPGAQVPVVPKVGSQTQTPTRFFHLENKLPPKPVAPAVQSPTTTSQPSTLAQAIGNALSAKPKVVQPRSPFSNIAPLPPKLVSSRPAVAPSVEGPKSWGSLTSPEPSKLLEDHEEPHIEFGKAPMQPRPVPEVRPSPRPFVASGEVGPTITKVEPKIPTNLPGAMPPVSVPPPVVLKSYTSDPYREPID